MGIKKFIKKYTPTEWFIFMAIMAFNAWWPIWGNGLAMPLCYISIIILFFLFNKHHRFNLNRVLFIFSLIIFSFIFLNIFRGFHFSHVLIAISFPLAYNISEEESINVLNLLTKYLALSVIISLPPWIVHNYIVNLPIVFFQDVSSTKGAAEVIYENYFFFIQCMDFEGLRFYSLFDEPGVLGTLAAFVLWANKYDFGKRENLVIFIGAIFTYSLAFYILTTVGYILKNRYSVHKAALSIVVILCIGLALIYFLRDSIAFQNAIIYRFTNIEDTGVDSRTSYEINQIWNNLLGSTDLFIGLGSDYLSKFNGVGGSYKTFIIQYGIFGALIMLLAYMKLRKANNYYQNMTVLLLFLSFLQRPEAFTAQMFMLCACIMNKFNYEHSLQQK